MGSLCKTQSPTQRKQKSKGQIFGYTYSAEVEDETVSSDLICAAVFSITLRICSKTSRN